jgi:co-chaperonin GroES (HSP10)
MINDEVAVGSPTTDESGAYELPDFEPFEIPTVGETMDVITRTLAALPEDTKLTDEERGKQLPVPTGYRMLCMVPKVEDKYASGLLKAGITMDYEHALSVVLFVAKMGPDCYKDLNKFPSGPYCKEGDFVLVRPNAGSKLQIHGTEWRIVNDDAIESVVDDPRGIKRA